MDEIFEVARLEGRGAKEDLDALFQRFALKGRDLGLETVVGFQGDGFLACHWLTAEDADYPEFADARAVMEAPVGKGFFAGMSTLLYDRKSVAALRNTPDGFGVEAEIRLDKSEHVFSMDLFTLWFESVSGLLDPVCGLPRLAGMLSGFLTLSPKLGPVVGLSAMESLRKALPEWAPAHGALPDTKALRKALAGVPKGLFDGSVLYAKAFGFDGMMSEALSCLEWLDGLGRAGGAEDVGLISVECAGSDAEIGEFLDRLALTAKKMGCSMDHRSVGGKASCIVSGRTMNVIDDVMLAFTLGEDGKAWPEGLSFVGDAVVTIGGQAEGVVRFEKKQGFEFPAMALFVEGAQYPGSDVMDNWIMAFSGQCEEEERQKFAEYLALKIPEGNDVERLFRLHALAVLMDGGWAPSREVLEGLEPISALLPEPMPDFKINVNGGGVEAEDVWHGAKRAAAMLENIVLFGSAIQPTKTGGKVRTMVEKADD